jgi:phosphorylcholine metabolism protein LicD
MDLDQDNFRVSPILMKNHFQRDTPPKQRHGHESWLRNSSWKSLEGDQVNEVSISLDDEISISLDNEISEESDAWGRKKSAEWKAGAGRKKSWKRCPVAKVAKKTQQVPYCKTK